MKRIAICLFSVFTTLPALAQVTDDPLTQLKQHFETYQHLQPEKIFLHTDRSFYASADTVWYKAYLVNPQTHKPHPVSEILYLDLISKDNRSIISQRLKTENGFKSASLILPDTLKAGNYLLQVYTNWQRNAGTQSFCRQPIWVNKVPQQTDKTVGNSAGKVLNQLALFPEGGKLLAGFEGKVGFKATTATGEIIPAEGKVVDETGKIVTAFRSNNAGLGSFNLRPLAGKTYRAQILINGQKKEFPLEVAEKGYALNVKNASDSVTVQVASKENSGPVYLILQSHGNLLSADSVMFNAKGLRKRSFSTRNWPEGIVQASLLNAMKKTENERLFFHRKAQPLQVKLETSKKTFGRREPVLVNLSLADEAGRPVEGEFSVAVTSNLSAGTPSLRQNLFFTSEITSMPPFTSGQPTDIDNLLLTAELSSFSWNAFANSEQTTPLFKRETELNQKGLVKENEELVKNAVLYLLETNSGKTYLLTSDAEGKFRVPAEGNSFFYQVWQNGLWRENARLTIDKADNALPSGNWNVTASIDSAQTKRLTLRRQIDRMYARESLKKNTKFVNTEMWPAYPANFYYPLEDYNQLNTMEEILREMVPSVRVVTRKKKVQANVYNEDTRTFYPNQPLYIIDGQPTWNNDLFLRLDAALLEQVNIYNSSKTLQPFGFMGNNGVIVVFTKSRNYQNPELNTENMLKVPGQNSSSQFVMKERPANIPDFRPTLYWNPELKTNAEGKASFTFKTSDEMGKIRVQVEGITKDGQLISEELLIPVQPAE